MATAKIIKHPMIEKLQANKRQVEKSFDHDVLSWTREQDEQTQRKINDAVRKFMNS